MPRPLNVLATSTGLAELPAEAGTELILDVGWPDVHRVAHGAAADDYLDLADRLRINRAVRASLQEWRTAVGSGLDLGGVPLTWVWEHELVASVFVRTIAAAEGLRKAVAELRPSALVTSSQDAWSTGVATAVARVVGSPHRTDSLPTGELNPILRPPSLLRRAASQLLRLGVPSWLHCDSVLVLCYWHLEPLLSELLEHGARPALEFEHLPRRGSRVLRAAVRGGFVGVPSSRAEAAGARRLERALAALSPPPLEPLGLPLGEVLHAGVIDYAQGRGRRDLAFYEMYRRALATRRAKRVIVPNDHMPQPRLLVHAARTAGVPSLAVQHGIYLRAVVEDDIFGIDDDRYDDLEASDEVAVWSSAAARALWNQNRPIHVVGFLGTERVAPPRSVTPRSGLRFLVLLQCPARITSLIPLRAAVQHAEAAIVAISAAADAPTITLRPHPSYPPDSLLALSASHAGVRVKVDTESEIMSLLAQHDVCIGSRSTATYQAALAGVPTILLNLTGWDWKWPLGGETLLPIARSGTDLEHELLRLLAAPAELQTPGRSDLLDVLGADRAEGAVTRLEQLVVRRG